MKATSYDSLGGKAGRITLEGETALIIGLTKDTTEAIEINLKKRLIRIYDKGHWTILPMDHNQQFDPEAKIIKHIDEMKGR